VPFPDFVRQAFPGDPPSLRLPLTIGAYSGAVKASGAVFPADFLDQNPAYACGSLVRESLAEIWEKGRGFQLLPRERDLSHTLCARCPDFPFCRGGLAERAFEGSGTFAAPDPWCHFSLARTHPGLLAADSITD
jgi:radical SAM protein with 4Fe4S-binding SPASM domain